jgi:N-acetyl-anhydromuramyl-L-alanine amidase AmpD
MLKELENKLVFSVNTNNFWKGRNGNIPIAIVLHITEGNLQSALNWLTDPKSSASYHFIVSKEGYIYKLVDPDNTAWHSGVVNNPTWKRIIKNVNPNYYTIGIALEGVKGEKCNYIQFLMLVRLITELLEKYEIEANDQTIIYHREINGSKTCPDIYINKYQILALL